MAEITKSLKETAGKITGGLGRGLSKLSSVFKSNKIEPAVSETSGSMSNTQYLGSIYQLMVDSDEERRMEYEREQNIKEESDSEEQRQHQEIIKALTLRRVPKRKKGISKEQKQSEKVEKTAKSTVGKKTKKPKVPKKGEPAKKDEPAKKPTDAEKDKRKEQKSSAKDEQIKKDKKSADDAKAAADKKTADAKTSTQKKEADRAQEAAKKKADDAKAAEEAKKASDARRAADDASKKRIAEDRAKKEAETKAKKEAPKTEAPKKEAPKTEAPKKEAPKTAEPVKQTPKQPAPKAAEPVKAPETVKPSTATQKPPAQTTPPTITSTAKKVGQVAVAGIGIAGLLMPKKSVASAIDKASDLVGVSKPLMYAIAKQESEFNPDAAAKTSSAKGLYQFINGTWSAMVKKYGEKYPILKQRGPEDAEANAVAGALYIKENSAIFAKSNIPINATTIYTAHFLGPGGAKKLFSLPPDAIAAESLPDAAKANNFIFYKKNEKTKKIDKNLPRTVKEITDVLFEKVGQYEEKYAKALNQLAPFPTNTGNKIDNVSKQNKDMKVQDKPAPVNVQQNTTNVSNTSESSTPPKVDDRPAHKRK